MDDTNEGVVIRNAITPITEPLLILRNFAGTTNYFTASSSNVYAGVPFKMEPVSAPSYEEGLLFYDSVSKILSFYDDDSDTTLQIGHEVWQTVLTRV